MNDMSQATFRDVLQVATTPEIRPTLKQIMQEVAFKHGVTVDDLCGPWRYAPIVAARKEFYYRARTETRNSYPAIGRKVGNRDHTTVMHGFKAFLKDMEAGIVSPDPHAPASFNRERAKPRPANIVWTQDKIETILSLRARGLTRGQIAICTGMSYNSVSGKLNRLRRQRAAQERGEVSQ